MALKELMTLESMLTLTGASSATLLIGNSIQYLFNKNPRWLALAVAEVISNVGVYSVHGQPIDYFVGVVNGFLIFCTAVGASQMTGRRSPRAAARGPGDPRLPHPDENGRRAFLTSWF
jgi:hypothetical protein